MMLSEVKQVVEVDRPEEATQLISVGWELLKIVSEHCYILGNKKLPQSNPPQKA